MRCGVNRVGRLGKSMCRAALTIAIVSCLPVHSAVAQIAAVREAVITFDIPAGGLAEALDKFSAQSGMQVVYRPELVIGKRGRAVSGDLRIVDALSRLIEGQGVDWERINEKTYALKAGLKDPTKQGDEQGGPSSTPKDGKASLDEKKVTGMPAVMVKGARTLNMDIERTADDPQPYVVFDRMTIERAGATNLGDFLRTRLPMNSGVRSGTSGSATTVSAVNSTVDLRGLGETQTLILIDGRRLAKSSTVTSSGQPDINGIPMEAIERIEVLPTTASAIYGGAATGGVINIIMRRDYVGTQVTVNYDNSFDTDSAIKSVNLSSGFSLLGGRTQVLLNASYSESNDLLVRDREFNERGNTAIKENDADAYYRFYSSFKPSNGLGANIFSTDRSDLVLKDGRVLGSSFTYAPQGYGGAASDNSAQLLANAGTYAPGSIDSSMSPMHAIISSPLVKYVSGSIRHEFSDELRGFLEFSRSDNKNHVRMSGDTELARILLPASAQTNPFQQDIWVNTSSDQLGGYLDHRSKSDRFSAGVIYQLPGEWMLATDYTYSVAERSYLNAMPYYGDTMFENGSVDLLRDLNMQDLVPYMLSSIQNYDAPIEATTKNPAIRLSGPIGSLKAGRPRVSMLLERQDNTFGESYSFAASRILRDRAIPERSQKVDSAYLELQIPILSPLNELSWVDDVELQLAGRWDRYESVNADFVSYNASSGSPPPFSYVQNEITQFSPLAAVRIRPNRSLTFRASYGEGFLPPDINQLTMPQTVPTRLGGIDPRRGNTTDTSRLIEITQGGNPELDPEYSTTRSMGVIYEPRWIDGLRMSVDYTNIKKRGGIITLNVQGVLDNEAYFPGRVTRAQNLPSDPQGWAGPVTAIDTTMINAADMRLEAYDVQVDYTLYTPDTGSFQFFMLATWQTNVEVQLNPAAPITDSLGWVSGRAVPLELKGNTGVTWTSAAWTLGWNARYASSYYVANPDLPASAVSFRRQGNGGRVPSQMYHDLFAKYQFDSRSGHDGAAGFLSGLELQVGVRNIFNKVPPYDFSHSGTFHSPIGDARLATYYMTLRKSF